MADKIASSSSADKASESSPNVSDETKKRRRKRGRGRKIKHYKRGSKGGRKSRSGEARVSGSISLEQPQVDPPVASEYSGHSITTTESFASTSTPTAPTVSIDTQQSEESILASPLASGIFDSAGVRFVNLSPECQSEVHQILAKATPIAGEESTESQLVNITPVICALNISPGDQSEVNDEHFPDKLTDKFKHHETVKVHSSTANVYLDRDQLIHKVETQQKKLEYAGAQIVKLRTELRKCIERDGVGVDEELSDDLCKIMEGLNLNPIQELMFSEQIKLAKAKSASGRRFHPTLIRFALLLRSTSLAAYKAVQASGAVILPSERTLYEYSHVVPAEPGCTKAKLDRVYKELVNKYPQKYQSYHILLMDEMHVNKKLVYLKSTGEMVGYVDVSNAEKETQNLEAELKGEAVCDYTPPVVTKILAFMVKGVASGIHELVASYPTGDGFDAEDLYDKTWEVIGALERSGIRVIGIVSDGAAINRAFYAMHVPSTKGTSVIFDTVNLCAPSRPIFFFSDVPHLLKTIRNCFYKSGTRPSCSRLLTKNGQVIIWKTIIDLYEEDRTLNLKRNHKLNSYNVYLNAFSVMKVSYAAQVLSNSVALDLKSRNIPGISETIIFIKKVNDFFDQLNGAHTYHGNRKANPNLAPYKDVHDKRFDELLEFLDYLNEWKTEVGRKQGFTKAQKSKMMLSQQTLDGIEMTIHSFIGATRFLLNEGVKFVNARVFCRDPLERYFSKQRQSGGGGRNPTAAQFYAKEVKIGVHRDVSVPRSNVLGEKRSLTVSDEPLPKRARNVQNIVILSF